MKLEVGKTYKSRDGVIVKITHKTSNEIFPYWGDSYHTYTKYGEFLPDAGHPLDLISEVKQPKNKEIYMKPEVEDEVNKVVLSCINGDITIDTALEQIKETLTKETLTKETKKLNPDDFYYPNAINWMWNYCIPLGKFRRSDGVKFDIGVYKRPDRIVSYAIVYGNHEGSHDTNEIRVTQNLTETEKETIRRYLNR